MFRTFDKYFLIWKFANFSPQLKVSPFSLSLFLSFSLSFSPQSLTHFASFSLSLYLTHTRRLSLSFSLSPHSSSPQSCFDVALKAKWQMRWSANGSKWHLGQIKVKAFESRIGSFKTSNSENSVAQLRKKFCSDKNRKENGWDEMCVCVCVWEREREREIESLRAHERRSLKVRKEKGEEEERQQLSAPWSQRARVRVRVCLSACVWACV